jgi:uncharacterized protein involved in outer membrane biogenesis
MLLKTEQLRHRATELARRPRIRKIALWSGAIVIAIGLIGSLAAPPLVRYILSKQLTKTLHRDVSIQQVRINPYALSATITGFSVKERQSTSTAFSFDELRVNLELLSIFQRGIVLKELRLEKPYVNLIRNENRTYNFQDLIDEFTSAPAEPAGPRPRFSLNNIEIIDGRIDFDDRPENTKHSISSVRIGVPFISSLPYHADLKVQPAFYALVNGAPIEIAGETTPFKDSLESTLHFELDKVNIPQYVEYSPVELNFKLPSGRLSGKLAAAFRTVKDKSPVFSVSGNLSLQELVLDELGDVPLLRLPQFDVSVEAYDVFNNKATIKAIKAQGLELHLTRGRDGNFNLLSLIRSSSQPAPTGPKAESTPFEYRIDEIVVDTSKLHFTDESPQRPYTTRLDNLHVGVKGLTNETGKKANVELSFQSAAKEQFNHAGTLQLTPLLAEGDIKIEGLQPAAFHPYYQNAIAAEIKEGFLDFSTHYSFEAKADQADVKLADLNATLRALRFELPGTPEPLWRIASLAVKNAMVDVAKKSIVIEALEGRDGSGYLQREPDGAFSYGRLVRSTEPAGKAADKKEEAGWNLETKQIVLDRFRINFDDRAAATPTKVSLSELSVRGENFSNAKNHRGKLRIRGKINNSGMLTLAGTAGANPVNSNFMVEAREIELLPFQSYLTKGLNLSLTAGRIGTKGKLTFDGGAGTAKLNYAGSLQIADFRSVEKNGAQELLKWKSLNLDGIHFALDPMQLRIDEINLDDFYSRLILGADGKINLQNLTTEAKEKPDAEVQTSQPQASVQSAPPANGGQNRINIDKINLRGGNINFSDFFVKPNYSANLTGVQGSISALTPESPGDLDLLAKLDNSAPVEIRGKINPLAKDLYLDIVADAKEIELNPFSPYSVKYVGYGIERGKLSFNVKYKLEARKLTADNKIILNQLTFGERVESPGATKLPVLLAVALLKDRNGVIDVDLPISGSLDDPQFSVGGIVLRIIINIITKAVTAPFTLLAAAFGGGAQELSYIEFDYGQTNLTQATEARIKTLATAMNNRPALKIEIIGRVDPVNDIEGLKRSAVERKLKTQKMKDLVRQGSAPKSLEEVRIEKSEYEKYLKAVYGAETFSKPRNVIGLAKDLPASEMESLIIKNIEITEDDLRELANRRAQAVRERLLAAGELSADRLSVIGAKPATPEDKETTNVKKSRVDFSLK